MALNLKTGGNITKMLELCVLHSWLNSARLCNATLGKHCENWTKRSHIYIEDRGNVLNLQTHKRRLKPPRECITHLLASLPHAPLPREGLAAAAGCQHWAVMLDCPWVAKVLLYQLCGFSTSLWLGWPAEAQNSRFRLFHFFSLCRKCLYLPNLQTSPPQKHGKREVLSFSKRTSPVSQLPTAVVHQLEDLEVHVSAVNSSRVGGRQKSKQLHRGWLSLTVACWGVMQEADRFQRWLEENAGAFGAIMPCKVSLL